MTTLHFMLGVVSTKNLELIHLDVKPTFLHYDLKEEIYMEHPKGFVAYNQEHCNRNCNRGQWFLSQTDYIGRVLECFNMQSTKSTLTSLPINLRLS